MTVRYRKGEPEYATIAADSFLGARGFQLGPIVVGVVLLAAAWKLS